MHRREIKKIIQNKYKKLFYLKNEKKKKIIKYFLQNSNLSLKKKGLKKNIEARIYLMKKICLSSGQSRGINNYFKTSRHKINLDLKQNNFSDIKNIN